MRIHSAFSGRPWLHNDLSFLFFPYGYCDIFLKVSLVSFDPYKQGDCGHGSHGADLQLREKYHVSVVALRKQCTQKVNACLSSSPLLHDGHVLSPACSSYHTYIER